MRFLVMMVVFLSLGLHANERVEQKYRSSLKKDPKSCSALYYGLFTKSGNPDFPYFKTDGLNAYGKVARDLANKNLGKPPSSLIDPPIQDRDKKEAALQEVRKLVQKAIVGAQREFDADPQLKSYPELVLEAKERLQDTVPYYAPGFYPALIRPDVVMTGNAKVPFPVLGKSIEGSPLYQIGHSLLLPRGVNYEPPRIEFGQEMMGGYPSRAGRMFWIGHELFHVQNWAPKKMQACFSQPNSLGARLKKSEPTAGKKGALHFGAAKFTEEKYRFEKKRLTAEKLHLTKSEYEAYLIELNKKFPTDKNGRLDLVKAKSIDKKVVADFWRFRYLEELCTGSLTPKDRPKQNPKRRHSGGGFGYGAGTEWIALFDACYKRKRLKEARELFSLVQKYESLPSQIDEAAADAFGIRRAVNFIKKNYAKKDQKRAAESILFSLPPMLYEPKDIDAIFSKIGSKMPNEHRVFRLLLANKEFRKLLGCKMDPAPKQCL